MPDSHQVPEAQAAATRQRRLMNLPILACMAALIILDVAARSRVSIAPLFVFLVVWAAWREGFLYASVSGLLLCAVHVASVWEIGLPGSVATSALDGLIRAVTFVALAFVISRAAWRFHAMRRHIVELERRLPVCQDCGLIRESDGSWLPLGGPHPPKGTPRVLCPECERKQYESHL